MKFDESKLVKFLAVIIMLGIALNISLPSIKNVINNPTKQAFVTDTKSLLMRIGEKMTNDLSFDPTIINAQTIHGILDVDSENYKSVNIILSAQKIHITVIGKGKWAGLTTCGTVDDVLITENSSGCI